MLIKIPTNEEIKQANRFRTYLNYLLSISTFIGNSKDNPKTIIQNVIQSRTFSNIQGKDCDIKKIGLLFRNAWFTEIQINIFSQFNEFISYSNHWTPVQTYYSLYLALRAYFTSTGQDVSREHASNLKAIGEEIKRRPSLFPQPWSIICVGNPENSIPELLNLPKGVTISKVSSLTSSFRIPFWNSYALFLKTTRKRQIETLCNDWKIRLRKKRICPFEKKKFIENLSPTTLFHILYRLRIRSNYADADSFLLSDQNIDDAISFHSALLNIGWYSLLVLELLVARHIGKRKFDCLVGDFRKYEKNRLSDGLIGLRWDTMKNLW